MTYSINKRPDEDKVLAIVFLVLFVFFVSSLLSSCSKSLHKNKTSIDSTAVHSTVKVSDSNTIKTGLKRRNVITNNTKKIVTTTTPVLIEVDTTIQNYDHTAKDYSDLPIVHSKGKTFVVAPKTKVVELDHFNKVDTGSESNSQITNTHQSIVSNDSTNVKKKEKEVVKKSGFNYWNLLWLLLIVPAYYVYKRRKNIKSFFKLV